MTSAKVDQLTSSRHRLVFGKGRPSNMHEAVSTSPGSRRVRKSATSLTISLRLVVDVSFSQISASSRNSINLNFLVCVKRHFKTQLIERRLKPKNSAVLPLPEKSCKRSLDLFSHYLWDEIEFRTKDRSDQGLQKSLAAGQNINRNLG